MRSKNNQIGMPERSSFQDSCSWLGLHNARSNALETCGMELLNRFV